MPRKHLRPSQVRRRQRRAGMERQASPEPVYKQASQKDRLDRSKMQKNASSALTIPGSLFPETHLTLLPSIRPDPHNMDIRQLDRFAAFQTAYDTYRESRMNYLSMIMIEDWRALIGLHPDPCVHEIVTVVLGSLLASGVSASCLIGSALIVHFLRLAGVECHATLGWLITNREKKAIRHVWVDVVDKEGEETIIDPGLWSVYQQVGMAFCHQAITTDPGPDWQKEYPDDDPDSEQLVTLARLFQSNPEEYWAASYASQNRDTILQAMDAVSLVCAKWRGASA